MKQSRVKISVFNALCFTDFSLRKWTKEDVWQITVSSVLFGFVKDNYLSSWKMM